MEGLRILMVTLDLDILLIQEPYVEYNISWPGCRTFHGAMIDNQTWTLTVVRNRDMSVFLRSDLRNDKYTVIEITNRRGFGRTLVNSYFKYNKNIEQHLTQLERPLYDVSGKMVVIPADEMLNQCSGIIV